MTAHMSSQSSHPKVKSSPASKRRFPPRGTFCPQTVTGADGETAVQRFTFTAPVTGAYEFYTGAAGENVSTSLNIFCEDESGVESVSYDYALDDTVSLIAALTEGVTYLLDAYGYVDEVLRVRLSGSSAFPDPFMGRRSLAARPD